MITHRYGLADAAEAYRVFASGETGKVLLCQVDTGREDVGDEVVA